MSEENRQSAPKFIPESPVTLVAMTGALIPGFELVLRRRDSQGRQEYLQLNREINSHIAEIQSLNLAVETLEDGNNASSQPAIIELNDSIEAHNTEASTLVAELDQVEYEPSEGTLTEAGIILGVVFGVGAVVTAVRYGVHRIRLKRFEHTVSREEPEPVIAQ